MQTNQKFMQKGTIATFIGEVFFTSPILIIACFIDLWFEYTLILLCMLFYKACYEYGYHAPENKSYICILVSYLCFILCLIVAYVFKKQYVTIFILCNIICYVNYYVGIYQYKATRFDIIKEPYERYRKSLIHKEFDLDNCTEEELIEQLKKHKILTKYYAFLIDVFVHKVRVVDYLDAPKNRNKLLDEQQLRNLKSKITKLLKPPN